MTPPPLPARKVVRPFGYTADQMLQYARDYHAAMSAPDEPEPDLSQEWAGMNGETAFWLIQRHADGWADVSRMMNAWLQANRLASRLADDEICDLWSWSQSREAELTATTGQHAFARAIERRVRGEEA